MIKWFHELFNPHCQHCIDERREAREESRYCASCEITERENARLVRENERLLDLVINKPKPVEPVLNTEELKPIKPLHIPWNVRRQQIEEERKAEAISRRNAAKPDINKEEELKELERELDSVSDLRNKNAGNKN